MVPPRIGTIDAPMRLFRFGGARLDVAQRQLLIDGRPAKLGRARLRRAARADRAARSRWSARTSCSSSSGPGWSSRRTTCRCTSRAAQAARAAGDRDDSRTRIPLHGRRRCARQDALGRACSRAAARQVAAPARPRICRRHSPPLYGRDDDAARASGELLRGSCRWSSIVGAGGIGKTRLALAVAQRAARTISRRRVVGRAGDAERRRASSPGPSPERTRRARSVRRPGARHRRAALLRNADRLLVLDNCEHLLDAAAECVAGAAAQRARAARAGHQPGGAAPRRGTGLSARQRCRSGTLGRAAQRRSRAVRRARAGRRSALAADRRQRRRSWPRSAVGSTASRWRSSWPPRACGCSASKACARGSTSASTC